MIKLPDLHWNQYIILTDNKTYYRPKYVGGGPYRKIITIAPDLAGYACLEAKKMKFFPDIFSGPFNLICFPYNRPVNQMWIVYHYDWFANPRHCVTPLAKVIYLPGEAHPKVKKYGACSIWVPQTKGIIIPENMHYSKSFTAQLIEWKPSAGILGVADDTITVPLPKKNEVLWLFPVPPNRLIISRTGGVGLAWSATPIKDPHYSLMRITSDGKVEFYAGLRWVRLPVKVSGGKVTVNVTAMPNPRTGKSVSWKGLNIGWYKKTIVSAPTMLVESNQVVDLGAASTSHSLLLVGAVGLLAALAVILSRR